MDAFIGFNFDKKPQLSALDRLFQQELGAYLQGPGPKGCFIPVTAQTGIGKTYTANALIIEQLLTSIRRQLTGQAAPAGLIYYVTNSVDNVSQTYAALQRLIDTQIIDGQPRFTPAQREQLKQRILYLPAQSAQLLATPPERVTEVLEAFGLSAVQHIAQGWQALQGLKRAAADHPHIAAQLQGPLKERASELYRHIVDGIQARQRKNPVSLQGRTGHALHALLPGERVRTGQAEVLFMTTDKFLQGYQSSRHRIYPIRTLAHCLLIVDEIDKQNEVILRALSEQPSRDLITLARTLYANLDYYQLEASLRYQGVDPLFEPLRQRLRQFADEWQIQYAFNHEGAGLDDKPIRLFSDRTVTHCHSATQRLLLKTHRERQKNVIFGVHKQDSDGIHPQGYRLSQFVNEADWIYRQFLQSMRKAIWRVMGNDNPGDTNGRFQEAVLSVLSHFNLSGFRQDVFTSLDVQLSLSRRKKRYRMAQRSYHDTGLKVVDITREEGVPDTVSCHFHGLPVSPTGLLANMVDAGARILGISATATSPTVIKNFDQSYLRQRLADKYIALTPPQQQLIDDYYHSRRRYAEEGVRIHAHALGPDHQLAIRALERFGGCPVRLPGTVLGQYLGQPATPGDKDYVVRWVSKVLQALTHFAAQPGNRYMMLLLNRTLKPSETSTFIALLKNHLAHCGLTACRIFAGLDAGAMSEGLFEEIRHLLSTTDDKILVFSTYASIGEGKNPDYPVTRQADKDNLIWVGSGEPEAQVCTDIDTLYLERPSHQLLGHEQSPALDRLVKLHQILSLQDAGWISPDNTANWVFRTLQGSNTPEQLGRYYRTEDYHWLLRKVTEQAVGRMARTAFKRPDIHILVDRELTPVIDSDPRPGHTLSLEYRALVEQFRTERADSELPAAEQRQLNLAILHTRDTLQLIRELLKGIQKGSESDIRNWEALRRQLLCQPTLAQPSGSCPRLYLCPPGGTPYAYQGSLETDADEAGSDSLRFYEQATHPAWVGEQQSGLPLMMQNAIVRRYFEQQGYATQWSPQPYVMTPAAFNNLYKGALGEEAIRALLLHYGFVIEPMPDALYERYDFMLVTADGRRVCVDAKYWRQPGEAPDHAHKAARVREHLNVSRFVFINLFGLPHEPLHTVNDSLIRAPAATASTLMVPGLLHRDSGALLHDHLTGLIEWTGAKP
jgi:hypothetical protein